MTWAHPQSARTSCRSANPLQGGAPDGPAKPVPWVPSAGCGDVSRQGTIDELVATQA